VRAPELLLPLAASLAGAGMLGIENRADALNINLPQHWFVTFYPNPDIRINYGDPITGQTGRLFLPMDFMIGRDLTKTITMSLEIGVPLIRDHPVYDFKAVTRLNMKL
jgi:hypothetical protein